MDNKSLPEASEYESGLSWENIEMDNAPVSYFSDFGLFKKTMDENGYSLIGFCKSPFKNGQDFDRAAVFIENDEIRWFHVAKWFFNGVE